MAASSETQLTGIQSSDIGLVQAVADNFDANITSPNGLDSTHALALLMTQVCPNTKDSQEDTKIKRLKKENIEDVQNLDLQNLSSTTMAPKSLKC